MKHSSKIYRIGGWLLAAVFVLFAVAIVGGTLWFQSYLRSAKFLQMVNGATSHALKADGEFLPFHYSGTTIYSDGFSANGNAGAFFSSLKAESIRADFNLRGVLHREWKIDHITVGRLRLAWKPASPEASRTTEYPVSANGEVQSTSNGWPLKIEQATILDANFSWPEGALTGAQILLTPNESAWKIAVSGGSVAVRDYPKLSLVNAQFRCDSTTLYISDASFRQGATGSIDANGEVDFGDKTDLQLHLSGVDVAQFLTPDWRAKLLGDLNGEIDLHFPLTAISPQNQRTISGDLALAHGQLIALPILNQIALFTHVIQFQRLNLTTAKAHFLHTDDATVISDLVLEDAGLLRVEGGCTVRDGQIAGVFQVGVTSASLQWLPGSQEKVFTTARGGYLWTTLHLNGDASHPQEDLSARLIAAAKGAMIEKAQGILNDTIQNPTNQMQNAAKGALDLLQPLLK